MKKSISILFAIVCTFTVAFPYTGLRANEILPSSFKSYMHKVFDSYNHVRISYKLNKHDITDIHLRQMKKNIALAQKDIPRYDKKGAAVNKTLFLERIATLQTTLSDLRDAVKYKEPLLTELFAKDIFKVCIDCHKEMKFDYLYGIPQHKTLFSGYMHKVSEHIHLASSIKQNANLNVEIEEHIKLTNYYLGLLKTTLPDIGPSGVILDKELFNQRLLDTQKKLQMYVKDKKQIDLVSVKSAINGLCVSCHKPERVK